MCRGYECPKKETCYRYRATPNEICQSYFISSPLVEGECEYYWPLKNENTISRDTYESSKRK